MHTVIVVPGIMGSSILLPMPGGKVEEVWPPTPLETRLGYKRCRKLADPSARAGAVIRKIMCFGFYEELFEQLGELGFAPDGADKRLHEFAYDWRRDLFDTATALAECLDALHAEGVTRISLVAHSMGGLICRLLLEDDAYRGRPWFAAIDQLIAIATPHLGAPLALARVLGLDSALGISRADFKWLSSQVDYPSAYQLLPAPGDVACWNQSDPALAAIDVYDPVTAQRLGLSAVLLARARALHAVLGANAKPTHVRYFYFAGTGHRTVTRINLFDFDVARGTLTQTPDAGDGTVPLFSALPQLGQRQIVVNEHSTAFVGGAFKRVFFRLLGGDVGPALEADFAGALSAPILRLSVEASVITAGNDIEVILVVDAPDPSGADGGAAIAEIAGRLILVRLADEDQPHAEIVRAVAVRYAGPLIDRLRLLLDPEFRQGLYELRFVGKPAMLRAAQFAICLPQDAD